MFQRDGIFFPPLADGFPADLLLAAGGDIEQKFNLLLLDWHSRSRRKEVFSCEVAKGKGTSGILKTTQQLVGFRSISPGPGAGRRLANLLIGALEASLPGARSVISVEGRARAKLLLERFYSD